MPKSKYLFIKFPLINLILLLLLNSLCLGQKLDSSVFLTPPLIDLPNKSRMIMLDINSTSFIRILDGLILEDDFKIPRSVAIKNVIRLSDTSKLRGMVSYNFQKPYIIIDTRRAEARWFIYSKVNLPLLDQGRNLPIVLNKVLLTPDKYRELEDLDTGSIAQIAYRKKIPASYTKHFKMPWGAICVRTDKEN